MKYLLLLLLLLVGVSCDRGKGLSGCISLGLMKAKVNLSSEKIYCWSDEGGDWCLHKEYRRVIIREGE